MTDHHISVINEHDAELLRLNQRVLEESMDLISIVGIDYRFYYVNPANAAVHGLDADDLVGHELSEFLGEQVFDEIVKPKLDLCFEGEDVRYEDIFHFPGHNPMYMDIRYLPLSNTDGCVDRAVVMIRDVTASRNMMPPSCRDKIMRLLDIARKVNHDINNPLFAITGYLELLLQIETDPKKTDFIDSALKNAHKVAEVARGLTNAINDTDLLPSAELDASRIIEIPDRRPSQPGHQDSSGISPEKDG